MKLIAAIALLLVVAWAILAFRIVFIPLVIGGIIAYLMFPLAQRVRHSSRLPHGPATVLLYLVTMTLIILVILAVSPLIIDTVQYFVGEVTAFAGWLQTVSPEQTVEIVGFTIPVQELVAQAGTTLADLARRQEPLSLVLGATETALLVVFTLLIGFYLTRDADKVVAWAQGLAPPLYAQDLGLLMVEIDHIWSAFFRGQFMLAAIVTVIITLLSMALGLPQPLLMGVLAGLLEFLPSVGHTIWIVTALIVALIEGSTYIPVSNVVFALMVGGAHFLFAQFDLNYLIPRIIGGHVHLHPMVVIIGIIIGAAVGGVLGVALAAPTIATLRVLGRYVYAMMFDLEPFPMIGPPSASVEERLAFAAQSQRPIPSLHLPHLPQHWPHLGREDPPKGQESKARSARDHFE